jgi:mannose-6-phosphate isomerase-like protein (cupin superfamily)
LRRRFRAVKKQPNPAMKISALIVSFALALCTHAGAADAPPTEVVFIDHTKVADGFAKGMPLLTNSSYRVQAGRRVMPGEAEVHASDTDIFFVTEGTATIMTGGKPVEPRATGTGEIRAPKTEGGVARRLVKGDVLIVPAGVPHWFSEVNEPFIYFLVKVTK